MRGEIEPPSKLIGGFVCVAQRGVVLIRMGYRGGYYQEGEIRCLTLRDARVTLAARLRSV